MERLRIIPRFNWQFRPGLVKNGSINISDDYFKGLESFVAASEELKDSPYYLTDLCEMTAHYLGGKAEILTRHMMSGIFVGRYASGTFPPESV